MSSRPLPRFAHSAVTVTSSSGGKPSTVSSHCLPWRPHAEKHCLQESNGELFLNLHSSMPANGTPHRPDVICSLQDMIVFGGVSPDVDFNDIVVWRPAPQ